MSGLKQLIQEIRRRSLWQVLAIYLVGAAVGYQLIETLVSKRSVAAVQRWSNGAGEQSGGRRSGRCGRRGTEFAAQ